MSDGYKDRKHDLLVKVRELAVSLGRTPTRAEFEHSMVGGKYQLEKHYKQYEKLLVDAGLELNKNRLDADPRLEAKLLKEYKSLCTKKELIQGFYRHTLDLAKMFELAGNPDILKISVQPDTHVKFRDIPAVKSYLKFLEYYQPDVHLILGDFPDCEGISHWPSSSMEPRRLVPEMKEARALLEEIKKATKKATSRIYCEGNHEDWINQGLSRMPELFDGLEDFGMEVTLSKLLNLDGFGYELFPMNHLVQIGKAHFTHGIYCGTHHAKKHLDVFKDNIYYGHVHDAQTFNTTSMSGGIEAAAQGCLCRLDAKFLKGRPNNWQHGHGVFEFRRDGSYSRYYIQIEKGISSFNGMLFDGNIGGS